MKKIMKVLCLVLVLMLVIAPVTSLATTTFKSVADSSTGDIGGINSAAKSIGGTVYNVFKTVAYIVAICMVCYMAIQWLMATPAKKAELKGRMWSMAIGVILLVAGVTLLDKVGTIGEDIVASIGK